MNKWSVLIFCMKRECLCLSLQQHLQYIIAFDLFQSKTKVSTLLAKGCELVRTLQPTQKSIHLQKSTGIDLCCLNLFGTFYHDIFRQVRDLKSKLEDIRFEHRGEIKGLQKKIQEPWNVVDLFWPNQRFEKWHCTVPVKTVFSTVLQCFACVLLISSLTLQVLLLHTTP